MTDEVRGMGGAVDLARGPALTGEQVANALKVYEAKHGYRCGGCGERIGVGFRFVRLEVVSTAQGIAVGQYLLGACNGADGCGFAEHAGKDATMVEMVEFAWVDGGDEPVAGGV